MCATSEANSTEEIEVTPEMIDAGEHAILCEVGGADLGGLFSAHELARRVYLAMFSLRPQTHFGSQT
jgi:hypothetical protein